MSLLISNIRIGLNDDDKIAINKAVKRINISKDNVKSAHIFKKSLDARRRDNISFVVSVVLDLFENETEIAKAISDNFVSYKEKIELKFEKGNEKLEHPIVIVGFGPAGIFAAYVLASQGYHPIVIEKGSCVDDRVLAVENFWKNGILNSQTNVQFGEGGAGTFSDGKLTTRISDRRCEYVLEQFVKFGAPEEILTTAKPHIGTDKLRNIIKAMREDIIAKGGKVYFNTSLIEVKTKNNKIYSVETTNGEIATENVILATGHSARDIFQMIYEKGIVIENKPFSVGVRIEQLQETIDKGLYGNLAGHKNLPKGEYQLSYKNKNRCVYTFCMCPGGYVVPSSSSENTVVVNGMSEHSRNGKNANSALVVSVDQNDFGSNPLGGMKFQENLESLAFLAGGSNYKAPYMTVNEFLKDKLIPMKQSVIPSYALGVTPADFNKIFSNEITDMLKVGLNNFDRKLPGFAKPDGILTGVETRTSSPIRILRNDECESINLKGLYPTGEGAGYAGGIISAAVDGIKVAQKIMEKYQPN